MFVLLVTDISIVLVRKYTRSPHTPLLPVFRRLRTCGRCVLIEMRRLPARTHANSRNSYYILNHNILKIEMGTVKYYLYKTEIMSAKTISIRPDLYEILNSTKGETESFSNVIERLVKEKKVNLSEFFGVLSDSRVLDELDAESKKMRENSRVRI